MSGWRLEEKSRSWESMEGWRDSVGLETSENEVSLKDGEGEDLGPRW